jgi:hypothetical protein
MNVKKKKIAGTSKYFLKIKKLLWVNDIIFITLEEGSQTQTGVGAAEEHFKRWPSAFALLKGHSLK